MRRKVVSCLLFFCALFSTFIFSLLFTAFVLAATAHAQSTPDPAYAPLDKAYEALRSKDYATAIAQFQQALTLAPRRASIHKDLAYTLLKAGDTPGGRDHFHDAMNLDPSDEHVALEYAFLAYETKEPVSFQQDARRIFARLAQDQPGKPGNLTAKEAFENVDRPLREGIARWQAVVAQVPENFSAHEELARLAERRDEFALAADQFQAAWKLRPGRRDLLLDLGRVWRDMNRPEQAMAALLAASRGAEPRVAETARGLLPDRYPYVYEFEQALQLDPTNEELRRELAYLHQAMGNQEAATRQFAKLPERAAPAADSGAPVLLDRNSPSPDARAMAERSLEKGYLKDAARYLESAHESDPADFDIMLKLGWTYNNLRDDREAVRWFDLARHSPNVKTAAEALSAYRNLSSSLSRIRTTVWMFPMISTRWKDAFAYAQAKAELRWGFPVHPYASIRFIGDVRGKVQPNATFAPQYLSERSAILALGVATRTWRGATAWLETGEAIRYAQGGGQLDIRGGLAYANRAHRGKLFAETNDDLLYVRRFNRDTLLYSQNRTGWTLSDSVQFYWNWNATLDVKREYWANTAETGPGVRWRVNGVELTANWLRGTYLVNRGNPYRPNYNDLRIGVWYAFSR